MSNTQPSYRSTHVFDPIHNGADECECGLTESADIHESDDAYEERMRPRIVNTPERIWLQAGCDDEVGEIDWRELSHSDVSWCDQKIHNTDIEYVRTDLLITARQEERRATFSEMFKVLCPDCAEGDEPTYDKQARWYYHGEHGHEVGCSASKLRIEATANDQKAPDGDQP